MPNLIKCEMDAKSTTWTYRLPGDGTYSIRFEKPVGLRAALTRIRKSWGFKRLPRGTEAWITKP